MARKNIIAPVKIASAQSLAAAFQATATQVPYLDNVSLQLNVTTSDSTGTFKIQATVDSVNWIDLDLGGGVPDVAAANVNHLINLNQVPFNALRVSYVPTIAGTGVCDVWVEAKQVGG